MTTQAVVSTNINAPIDAVWPWVANIEQHSQWSPKPYSVELVSGEPNAVGSRYRSVGWVPGDKDHVNEVEVAAVVPGERLVLHATDENGTFENTYELRETGAGTEVSYRLVFPPMKGMAAVMVPILFPLVGKPDIRKRMRLLKEGVESA